MHSAKNYYTGDRLARRSYETDTRTAAGTAEPGRARGCGVDMDKPIRIGIIKAGGLAVITLGDGKFEPWEESQVFQMMTAAPDLLDALKGLLALSEKQFGMLEQTVST